MYFEISVHSGIHSHLVLFLTIFVSSNLMTFQAVSLLFKKKKLKEIKSRHLHNIYSLDSGNGKRIIIILIYIEQ